MATTQRITPVLNGKYTIQNKDTGKHRTFRIKTQKTDAKFAPGARIVSVMTGTDNQNHYTRFAFINDNGIHLWGKYKGNPEFEGYKKMLWGMASDPDHPLHMSYTIDESLNCVVCNRELTNPESIATGIGPVCGGRV